MSWLVVDLDQCDAAIAAAIHAVQMAAYAQEAALIGAADFPPLQGTVLAVQRSDELFLGCCEGGALVGALSIELGAEPPPAQRPPCIASLVVAPAWQGRGIGRSLLTAALARLRPGPVTVSTAAKNHPAIALYRSFGFVVQSSRWLGSPPLEVVALVRAARPPTNHCH